MRKKINAAMFFSGFVMLMAFSSVSDILYPVQIKLLPPVDSSRIYIEVKVTNNTKKQLDILKYRRYDHKWGEGHGMGNYIVEVQRKESNGYTLFTPSADIDFFYTNTEATIIKPGNVIIDTLRISGSTFSRYDIRKARGFPPGSYRVCVYFNLSEWSHSEKNSSDWVKFEIP